LTAETARVFFTYSPDDGVLRWAKKPNRRIKEGSPAGSMRKDGYLEVEVLGVRNRVHRVAWLIVYGSFPDGDIDHINGIRSDNRIENLRCLTRSENIQNQRRARSDNKTSGMLGVTWSKSDKKWCAKITVNGRCTYIGNFNTAEAAHAAYVETKRILHKSCTI